MKTDTQVLLLVRHMLTSGGTSMELVLQVFLFLFS